MNPTCVRKPEQIILIMECRQSGLFDYQWRRKQGISPRNFYNWGQGIYRWSEKRFRGKTHYLEAI